MSPAVKYPNWQSRLLLSRVARKQPIHPVEFPRPIERFLQWYERRILKVDVGDVPVDNPIFLVGTPRSGGTMLQDMMCSHEHVCYVTNTMNRFPAAFCAIEHNRRRLRLDFESERYLSDSVPVSASSPSDGVVFWGEWFHLDPFSLDYHDVKTEDVSADDVEKMNETIRKVIWCFGTPYRRYFNTLRSVMQYTHVIKDIFPAAKFVHIVRDARLTANSLVKLCRLEIEHQTQIKSYREDPEHGKQFLIPYPRFPRLHEYVKEYGAEDVRTTANLWNDAVSYMDGLKDSIDNFYEVRFEDILANPGDELQRIFEFCELPPVGKDNTAFWSKIDKVGAVRHRNKYDSFDLVESICRENLEKHGYLD